MTHLDPIAGRHGQRPSPAASAPKQDRSRHATQKLPCLAAATCLATWLTPAFGLQLLDARDGVAIEAVLSRREPTRIRIEAGPITDVFGSIHSSNCGASPSQPPGSGAQLPAMPGTNPSGEVVLECDRDKGEIYVRPVDESPKPVNLFISSAQGTYTLILRKADTPADTIVIRDRSATAHTGLGEAAARPASAQHIRAMKSMLVAMASGRMPGDISVREIAQPVQLWQGTRFLLMRRYLGRGLVGEVYTLQNTGKDLMVLAEQEFDAPDDPPRQQVLGIALGQLQLRAGETTDVYVIRREGQ